ncbi:MAG: hypothetical protein F6K62_07095 [Sphaerospermopsis sp. SIO1G2]|nr:hypothetical protein [Sphaerospermopsis sp. SIO1G2]
MNRILISLGVSTVLLTSFTFLNPVNAGYQRFVCNRTQCLDRQTNKVYSRNTLERALYQQHLQRQRDFYYRFCLNNYEIKPAACRGYRNSNQRRMFRQPNNNQRIHFEQPGR